MTGKPLWVRLCEMTSEERRAEMDDDVRRKNKMGDAERGECLAKWASYHHCYDLANATGYQPHLPLVAWLIERRLIVETDGGYAFTAKAAALRLVEPS